MAVDGDDKPVSVDVLAVCDTNGNPASVVLWNVGNAVTYPDATTNQVNLNNPSAGTVNFSLGNYFTPGQTNPGCAGSTDINPTGNVKATVSGFNASEVTSTVQCDSTGVGCAANTYISSGAITGALTVARTATSGTKTGALKLVWTPAS